MMFVTVPKCSLLIIKVIKGAHQHGSHQTNEHLTHPNLYLPTLSTVASVIGRFTSDLLCCAITGNQYEKVVTSGARCEPLLTPGHVFISYGTD